MIRKILGLAEKPDKCHQTKDMFREMFLPGKFSKKQNQKKYLAKCDFAVLKIQEKCKKIKLRITEEKLLKVVEIAKTKDTVYKQDLTSYFVEKEKTAITFSCLDQLPKTVFFSNNEDFENFVNILYEVKHKDSVTTASELENNEFTKSMQKTGEGSFIKAEEETNKTTNEDFDEEDLFDSAEKSEKEGTTNCFLSRMKSKQNLKVSTDCEEIISHFQPLEQINKINSGFKEINNIIITKKPSSYENQDKTNQLKENEILQSNNSACAIRKLKQNSTTPPSFFDCEEVKVCLQSTLDQQQVLECLKSTTFHSSNDLKTMNVRHNAEKNRHFMKYPKKVFSKPHLFIGILASLIRPSEAADIWGPLSETQIFTIYTAVVLVTAAGLYWIRRGINNNEPQHILENPTTDLGGSICSPSNQSPICMDKDYAIGTGNIVIPNENTSALLPSCIENGPWMKHL